MNSLGLRRDPRYQQLIAVELEILDTASALIPQHIHETEGALTDDMMDAAIKQAGLWDLYLITNRKILELTGQI